jgi:hypothetical protein
MTEEKPAPRYGFEPSVAGKVAECDGGSMMGPKLASRQDFRGRLTGKYVEDGDPPWRWYLLNELTMKPDSYAQDAVWCEVSSIFMGGGGREMPPGPTPIADKSKQNKEEPEK